VENCRISVLIPSRGRVRQLAACLTALHMCESGEHDVRYRVACDDDDPDTGDFLRVARMELPIDVRFGPRPDNLGSVANDLAAHWPADVYQVFGDDLLCITYGWDKNLAAAVEKTPHGVFWMKSARNDESLVPAVTEKWRAAAGGIFTEHFPFWYDDLWLIELWVMATDADPIYLENTVLDKPTHTHRMRDLAFWSRFFIHMRQTRVEHGREIARNLGFPAPIIGQEFANRMNKYEPLSAEFAAKVELSNKAETTPPSAAYLRMKARAENLMRIAA